MEKSSPFHPTLHHHPPPPSTIPMARIRSLNHSANIILILAYHTYYGSIECHYGLQPTDINRLPYIHSRPSVLVEYSTAKAPPGKEPGAKNRVISHAASITTHQALSQHEYEIGGNNSSLIARDFIPSVHQASRSPSSLISSHPPSLHSLAHQSAPINSYIRYTSPSVSDRELPYQLPPPFYPHFSTSQANQSIYGKKRNQKNPFTHPAVMQ